MLREFSYFLSSLFVRLKSDDNLTIDVWVFEFRCNLHYIDLIRTRIIWWDRIWKSRVRFLFAEKLRRLLFLWMLSCMLTENSLHSWFLLEFKKSFQYRNKLNCILQNILNVHYMKIIYDLKQNFMSFRVYRSIWVY